MSLDGSPHSGLVAYAAASDAESVEESDLESKQNIVRSSLVSSISIKTDSEGSAAIINSSTIFHMSSNLDFVPPQKKPKLGTGMSLLTGYDEDDREDSINERSPHSIMSADKPHDFSPSSPPMENDFSNDEDDVVMSAGKTIDDSIVFTPETVPANGKKKISRPGTPPPSRYVEEENERPIDPSSLARSVQNLRSEEIVLPPEPSDSLIDEDLQRLVSDAVARMKRDSRYDPNRNIQDNKDFRNPSIYEKLIAFLDIDEKGSNFPLDIYNPHRWTDKSSYYDELARVQNDEMKKREERKTGNKKIDFVSVTKTTSGITKVETTTGSIQASNPTEGRKKSKWDAPPAALSSANKVIIPSVGSLTKKKN